MDKLKFFFTEPAVKKQRTSGETELMPTHRDMMYMGLTPIVFQKCLVVCWHCILN